MTLSDADLDRLIKDRERYEGDVVVELAQEVRRLRAIVVEAIETFSPGECRSDLLDRAAAEKGEYFADSWTHKALDTLGVDDVREAAEAAAKEEKP
jgi:hypothetical protein